jgi:hypothetical protein
MALDRTMLLRVIPRAGGPKVQFAGFHALLTTDTNSFIDHPGKRSSLPVHLKGSYRAGFEARRVSALMAHLWLVIPLHVILLHQNPGERRSIPTAAVEVRADDLADAASGTQRFISQDHPLGQGYLLAVGEGENFQQIPDSYHASEASYTQSDAF